MKRWFFQRMVKPNYDVSLEEPVLSVSICTGEATAGFLSRETGAFRDVMLIRGDRDLASFRSSYGIVGDIRRVY